MKKTFKLTELDCAHCAAKMEDAIRKLPNVQAASINFVMQKLTIEAADECFDEVVAAAQKEINKVEPDCEIVVK